MQRIVTILDTALTVNYNDRPISTQKDLDTYKFQFDESWLGYVKTAVFYTDPAMVKHLLIPEDGIVTIPWEILTGKPQVLYIGVFGAKDSIIKPTTFGAVRLREGSYIDGVAPLPPTPDVYQQIISAWEGAKTEEEVRVANENSRKNNFDALVIEYNALKAELEQEITDGTASVDALQVLESQYAAKALALETTYAPKLTSVESQLVQIATQPEVIR